MGNIELYCTDIHGGWMFFSFFFLFRRGYSWSFHFFCILDSRVLENYFGWPFFFFFFFSNTVPMYLLVTTNLVPI